MLLGCQAQALVSTPTASTRQLAAELSQFGLTVLSEPQLDCAQLQQVRQRCSSRLSALIDELSEAAVDPIEQHYTFTEIAHRQRLRWDLRMPEGDPLWQNVCEAAVAVAMPVIEQLHPPREAAAPRMLMSGVLISRPGATAQRWHVDCDVSHLQKAADDPHCRIYNCFMPLVDIASGEDGTEFWPTSHASSAVDPALPPPTCPPVGAAVAPACPAGGMLLADYRTMHRGLANAGRERLIAYVVLGVGKGAQDTANFSPTAIRDTSPRVLEQLPFWSDWE